MKVTIDTKEDSHEDIQKVIQILTNMLHQKEVVTPTAPVEDTTNMMSMFANPTAHVKEEVPVAAEPVQESAPDFSAFLNLAAEEKKEPDDEAKIEFF